VEGAAVFIGYTTLPTLEPVPGGVFIVTLDVPLVLALALLGFVVCARWMRRTRHVRRRLHVAQRSTVSRAA
jgi:hypothetical protein